jgi:hypothetical protein
MSAMQSTITARIKLDIERRFSVSPQELFARFGFTKNTSWNEIRIKMRSLKEEDVSFEDPDFSNIWCQQDVTDLWNISEKQYQAHLERLKINPNLMKDLEEELARCIRIEKQMRLPRENSGFYRQKEL